MDGRGHITAESPRHGAGVAREMLDPRSNVQHSPRLGDGRNTPRKPTPLQVSETPPTAAENTAHTPTKSPKSPIAGMRSASDALQHSPRSPHSDPVPTSPEPKSPRERLEELLATEHPTTNGNTAATEVRAMRNATASPTKSQSYGQLRNVSSPLPDLRPSGHSSPPSPRTGASPPLTGSLLRPGPSQMPRTSSIDSAISTISMQQINAAGHAHKASADSISASMPDISRLIGAAGSPEAVIHHLLKEKAHAAAQNAQLWKLVDKQRSLVLGLNKDLERATEDKEHYRRKYKDLLDRPAPLVTGPSKISTAQPPRAASRSPANSDASVELPMQRQDLEPIIPRSVPENGVLSPQSATHTDDRERDIPSALVAGGAAAGGENWVKNRSPKTEGNGHAHSKTSSSDVNILGPFTTTREVTPLQTRDLDKPSSQASPTGRGSPPASATKPTMPPTNSFTAKRSVASPVKAFNAPNMILTEATPDTPDTERMTPPRKLPPAPLNLGHVRKEPLTERYGPEDHSDSEYEDVEVEELPSLDRGRKKTREDDDRERKAALSKEKEDRSRSKKEKGSKARSGSSKSKVKEGEAQYTQAIPMPPSIKALVPEPIPGGINSFLSPPTSLAGVLHPQESHKESSFAERTIPMIPMSPGLPLSPRPNDRPANQPPPTPRLPRDGAGPSSMAMSPPLSPRGGFVGLPLSPRAPKQAIPLPPHTPMSMAPASPMPIYVEPRKESVASAESSGSSTKQDTASSYAQIEPETPPTTYQTPESPRSRGVFKGFISEAYPALLIPPNALPSIKIKVVSSRLKPSRNSLVLKGTDDEPVFTLGVSARYDRQDLWQVEKPILSLQQLDQQLRQSSGFSVKLPERSLFSGHAPAKIDARRVALENYFEAVLDTQLDEKAAVALCSYLSTQVSEPAARAANGVPSASTSDAGSRKGSDGRLKKEGYLTKRGKNFGGWKARFFVLDKPVLEYFEAPGGRSGPLGQIRLHNAQIGKQSPKANASPSRGDDGDGQYRHAFLIREPKRKDATAFMDHVLCAESDAERDAWVAALLCYVDGSTGSENDGKARPTLSSTGSGGSTKVVPAKKNSLKADAPLQDSPRSEIFDSLQAVPYEETKPAQAPHVAVTPDLRTTETPSPTTVGSGSYPSQRAPSAQSAQVKAISGPQNGGRIENLGAWGNKPMASPLAQPKEQKKRGLWGFLGDNSKNEHLGSHPNNSNHALTQKEQEYQEHATNVKAQFGAPLAEAVEYCAPRGIDVCLPAVVYRCLEYLEAKNAAGEEGIFRMSGSNNLIKHLRHKFNTEGDYDFLGEGEPYCDVHAVASLLKLYLRELPSMILTRELHMQFLSVLGKPVLSSTLRSQNTANRRSSDVKDDTKKIAAYNFLVHRLPRANFFLIRALSAYLITIVNASDVNKMGIRNVCIVFSPTLNIPTPVFGMFLSAFDEIFEEDAVDPSAVPALEVTSSSPDALTPEDIRSPRKQMFSDALPTPSYNQESFAANSMNSMLFNDVNGNNSTNYHANNQANQQTNNDTGFIPMQPAYEGSGPISIPYSQTQAPGSVTVPGPEYAVARPRNLAPGGSNKARRRESSMLLMGAGQRKNSLPQMRSNDPGSCDS